jgi:hypothetical protein
VPARKSKLRPRAQGIGKLLRGLLPLAVCLLAWPVAAQAPTMPESLRGYWYGNDQHGQQQCQRYLADPEDGSALVGQLRIRSHDFDAFSEYGEGNHSQVTGVRQQGTDRWQVSDRSFIEGDVDHGTPGESVFRLSDGLLHLGYGYTLWHDGVPTQQTSERTYFRCK